MGSVTSSIPSEPILAAAAVAGALGYGYVLYARPVSHSDNDADPYGNASMSASTASSLRGQKKRGRKLRLPGDATLMNLDILFDAPPGASGPARGSSRPASRTSSAVGTRQRQQRQQQQLLLQQQQWEAPAAAQPQDVIPGGFDGRAMSVEDNEARDGPSQPHPQDQQHVFGSTAAAPAKKPKKKKGKKAEPSSASGAGADSSPSLVTSKLSNGAVAPAVVGSKGKKGSAAASATAGADTHDERWTRVEARKKKASSSQMTQDDAAAASAADVTTSDAGITTSATGNSSPVTERTTEDELPSELEGSTLEVSAVSLQGAPPRVAPVRPLLGEQPAKGFSWDDYEGVQVDEDASDEEEGGWGVVRSRRRPNKTASEGGTAATTTGAAQSQPLTKKQRQNAQRREALKEVKREREAQQQVALASHKRELQSARVAEQAVGAKRTGSRFDSLG